MSNTRRSPDDNPDAQERFLSAPEYAAQRGLSGPAVTAKACLLTHPAARNLVYFLQALSLRPGGLPQFCRDFLAHFPQRLGTSTMHRLGNNDSKPYSPADTFTIEDELSGGAKERGLRESKHRAFTAARARALRELYNGTISDDEFDRHCVVDQIELAESSPRDYASFRAECLAHSRHLDLFLTDLCINPELPFGEPGEPGPALFWFKDIIGALYEYQAAYESRIRADYVMTEVGRQVFETLDLALSGGKKRMVVIQGNSGIGKSTACEAWFNCHLGQARLISLSGISHKTGIFRMLARALGLGGSLARSSTEMQTRIEDLLQRSGLMLLVDEAHHFFSPSERIYSRPEIVDWINTACVNHGIPVGLVCTPQFTERLGRVEKQTSWNADQLRTRVRRFCALPVKPRKADLVAVARKLIPEHTPTILDLVVGYARSHPLPFSALTNAIEEARLLAQRAGRDTIIFEDAKSGIFDYSAPSSAALKAACDAPAVSPRRRRAPAADPALDDAGAPPAAPHPGSQALRPRTNLTGLAPAETSAGNDPSAPLAREWRGEPAEA